MRKILSASLMLAALAAALWAAEAPGAPAGSFTPAREVLVPFEDLPLLLEEQANRVLLTRREYEELLAKAKRGVETRAPLGAAVLSADYLARVSDERAVITGTLSVDVLEDGLHALGLEIGGVGLRAATLDGRPAAIGLSDDGRPTLFVEGKGTHALTFEMTAPIQTTAARQVLDVQLPTPAAARMRLTVPGDVEVKSGAPVVSRVFDEKAGETRFELLPASERQTIVMTLNSRLKRHDRVVVSRGVLVDEITEASERLGATFRLDVLHRAVDSFRFVVPDGFEVTDVSSVQLSRWAVTADGARKVLEVSLREEATGLVSIDIGAVRMKPDLSAWTMPTFEPLDVEGHTCVVGLLIEDRLRIEGVASKGLIPVDVSFLGRAMPKTLTASRPGLSPVRPVLAFYSPQSAFELSARFPKPPARVRVTSNLLVILEEKGLDARGGFAIVAEEEKVFAADVSVPAGWEMLEVTAADGSALAFEKYDEASGASRVRVTFPKGVAPGGETRFYIHARRTPGGWLDAWSTRSVELPAFTVAGAARDIGALAVDARDDMSVRPQTLDRLLPVDENELPAYGITGVSPSLAYRYESQPWSGSLVVERVPARVTAQTYSFVGVRRDSLAAHYEIFYDVAQARTRILSFLLPASTPDEIAVRGLDDLAIKEFTSEPAGPMRRWNVTLAERKSGRVKLAIDFQQKLTEAELKGFVAPIVRAGGVAYEWGRVSVEGSAELDVKVDTKMRKLDVGELVDASYQPGNRLLGVFAFVGEPGDVKVSATRDPAYDLPPAIIERLDLATVLAAEGLSQSEARFRLRTKALLVEVRLPKGSTLWSAALDGEPIKPQKEGGALIVNLPAGPVAGARELVFLYETPVGRMGLWSRLSVPAPGLRLHVADAPAIPAVEMTWQLFLPGGYRLVRSEGTMRAENLATPELAATEVLSGVYAMTGGIEPGLGGVQYARRTAKREYGWTLMKVESGERPEAAPTTPAPVEGEESQLSSDMLTLGGRSGAGDRMAEAKREQLRLKDRLAEQFDGFYARGLYADAKVVLDRMKALAPGDTTVEDRARKLPSASESAGRLVQEDKEYQAVQESPVNPQEKSKRESYKLAGFRSLVIDLQKGRPEASAVFTSLGLEPSLDVTVANERRLTALAWTLALGVLLAGVALTSASLGRKATYVFAVAFLATLIPVLLFEAELALIFNGAFYAACLLVPYYLVAGLVRWVARKTGRWPAAVTGSVVGAVVLALLAGSLVADDGGPYVVQVVGPEKPIKVPEGVIVVPYDPESRTGIQDAQKLLLPYDKFVEMWNLAYPDKRIETKAPPAAWAVSGAAFRARLEGTDFLLIEGSLEVNVFTDDAVAVPLPLEGGVLAKADLDGRPARLSLPQMIPPPMPQRNAQNAMQTMRAQPMTLLHVSGKGKHRLDLAVRMKLERQGGWRIAAGRLPSAPATALTLDVPAAQTELVLSGVADRLRYETATPGQRIDTALDPSEAFSIRWRPRVVEGEIDASLTAESTATFDVREDLRRLTWSVTLAFRKGERDAFSFDLPAGWLVERVSGGNVRGWEVKGTRLDVVLLNKARESETIQLTLTKPGAVGLDAAAFDVPAVSVPGAARQSGSLMIRRSPLLDVRATETAGVSRIDFPNVVAGGGDDSPLGIRAFQAFRFNDVPFTVKLSAAAVAPRTTGAVTTLLRLLERERRVDAQAVVNVQGRPLYRVRVAVPDDFKLDTVDAPGAFEWALTTEGGRRVVTVYLAAGMVGDIGVAFHGTLGDERGVAPAKVPVFEMLDVDSFQGDVAVVADPLYDVRAETMVKLENILVSKVFGWVTGEMQPQTRLALHYSEPGASGSLVLAERKADVTCNTVTNVRVTERSVEETILFNFTITRARIREVSFLLPARMKDANVRAPLLRRKIVEPVKVDGVEMVRVTVQLQDGIPDQLRVVVDHDRVLTSGVETAAIPVVETGRTLNRYVLLESAGRDEVELSAADGLEAVGRQQKVWATLSEFMKTGVTQAWSVQESAPAPRLAFRLKTRELVETVKARIGLGTTRLVLDAGGAYRAVQVWRVQNAIEQFLEIEVPAGASVWTALVAGDPVKPVLVPGGPANVVRIPLVKTAEGDLDYEVVVKYGGQLGAVRSLRGVDMPLVRTRNIACERSQVMLYLPEAFRWVHFSGTMREVGEAGDFELAAAQYWNGVATVILDSSNSTNPYARARAENNWQEVQSNLARIVDLGTNMVRNEALQKEAADARGNASRFKRQATLQTEQAKFKQNREVIDDLFEQQRTDRRTMTLGKQYDFNKTPGGAAGGGSGVNEKWLEGAEEKNEPPAPGPAGERYGYGVGALAGKKLVSQAQPAAPDVAQKEAKSGLAWKGSAALKPKADLDDYQGNVNRYQQRIQGQKAGQQVISGPIGPAGEKVANARDEGGATYGWDPTRVHGVSGLASLDVDVPERGIVYRFTMPRGQTEITGYAVSSKFLGSLKPLGFVLAAAIIAFVVRSLRGRNLRLSVAAQSVLSTLCIIAGPIMMVLWVLPVVGFFALAGGIVWKVIMRIRRRRAATA